MGKANRINFSEVDCSGLLRLDGTTAAFPALKRNSTTMEVRLADDSNYAPLRASSLTAVVMSPPTDQGGSLGTPALQWSDIQVLSVQANNENLVLGTDIAGNVILSPATGNDIHLARDLIALGGGAAPTLGTIGGSGPATAAQNSWMRFLDGSGAPMWVPVWK